MYHPRFNAVKDKRMTHEKTNKLLVTWILVVIYLGWIILVALNRPLAIKLVREDGVVQWGQFMFLVMTAFYFLRIALRKEINLRTNRSIKRCFIAFLFLSLLIAFEEISWGQRIFGVETPGFLKRINAQHETTFHNLIYFQRYRHWLLLIFGFSGLVLIEFKANNFTRLERFSFLIPPAYFKLSFCLITTSGIGLEIGEALLSFSSTSILIKLRYWAGRSTEIGELGVAIVAYAYATLKFKNIQAPVTDLPI